MNEGTIRKMRVSSLILLFAWISFLGWVMETVSFYVLYGEYDDRGFLTLPFCTIYGFSIVAVYYLMGTPKEGGFLLEKFKNSPMRWGLYFVLAMLLPTLAELLTGAFFEKAFGLTLWSYNGYPYNFRGYICLGFSLLWGALITLFMSFVFPFMKKAIEKLPPRVANVLALLFLSGIVLDWGVCFAKAFLK